MKKLRVVIHNDDCGLSFGFTQAILDSFKYGITTSTSIRPNGLAYDEVVKALKTKKLDTGIHLNLTDGKTFTKSLSNTRGRYKHSFFYYAIMTHINKKLLLDITNEFRSQILKLKNDKISISHLDSERHVHMIPPIFEVACKLCDEYKIKNIRIVNEPYSLINNLKDNIKPFINTNIVKFIILKFFVKKNIDTAKKYNIKFTDAFYGILHTNNMSKRIILSCISDAIKRNLNTIEISGHPAYANNTKDKSYTSPEIEKYVNSANRKIETQTFTNKNFKAKLLKLPITLTNYQK